MLELLLIYWIGKWHFKLAKQFNKPPWGYAILGVLAYLVGTISAAFIILFNASPSFNPILIGICGIPFGILVSWGLHALLKNSWKNQVVPEAELLDDTTDF